MKTNTVRPELLKLLAPQRGAAAVEFAIVLPLLVIILFGTIEFGVFMFDQQVITNASREGARAGIVSQTPRKTAGEISAIVDTYAVGRLITFGAASSPSTTVEAAGILFGDNLKVTVTYQYSFLLIPGFIPGISGTRTMTATTVMKYE